MSSELYTQEQKDQFFALLNAYPDTVSGLREAIVQGRIEGNWYWDIRTDCGCVIGTIVSVHYNDTEGYEIEGYVYDVRENAHINTGRGETSEFEELLYNHVRPGHTPANNPVSALLLSWVDEWTQAQGVTPE